MRVSRLSQMTVGALSATAVVLAPLTPDFPRAAVPELTAIRAAELTAFDVITPWLSVFNNTVNNAVRLINDVIYPPLPVAQQAVANQLLYLSELPDIATIGTQAAGNLSAAVTAPVGRDLFSMDIPHALGFVALETALAKIPELAGASALVTPLLNFTASFASGALIGLIGPVLSPALALSQSVLKITAAMTASTPDVATALSEVINIVPTVLDAFLNGGPVLAATPLVSVLGSILGVNIPAVTTVGIAMGGLLSPGGSLFNTADLSIQIDLPDPEPPVELALKGVPSGALGSLLGIPRSIARAIGWDGFGNPLKPGIPVPGGSPAGLGDRGAGRSASAVVSRTDSRPSPAATAAPTQHRQPTGSRAPRR